MTDAAPDTENRSQFAECIRQELGKIPQKGMIEKEAAHQAWQRVNALHENLVQGVTRTYASEGYTSEESELFSDMAKIRVRLHQFMGSHAYTGM
jgi:hypothetical protein